jgi:hypothetical protein
MKNLLLSVVRLGGHKEHSLVIKEDDWDPARREHWDPRKSSSLMKKKETSWWPSINSLLYNSLGHMFTFFFKGVNRHNLMADI